MIINLNVERLRLARESRGLNQTELNELTGLPMTAISKAERGVLNLSVDQLGRIAKHTRYPVSFFTAPGKPAPHAITWRKREKVNQKLMIPINARIEILRLHVQALTRDLNIRDEYAGFPCMKLSETFRPADAVKALRKLWHLPEEPTANLTLVLETQKIPVASFDFGTERLDARACITDDLYPLICINGS